MTLAIGNTNSWVSKLLTYSVFAQLASGLHIFDPFYLIAAVKGQMEHANEARQPQPTPFGGRGGSRSVPPSIPPCSTGAQGFNFVPHFFGGAN